jgi:hypothetical protein
MSEIEGSSPGGAPPRSGGKSDEVAALMARGQRLAELPRPAAGRPLAWHVEAYYLGDLAALAAVKARG